eukprot:TRINITY_DN16388_c0_g1_i1.p1 TRINITY_DN16388_c0_g1~~TRINITY_DN16388_c0_g1_i1.p1  ORF type:complete len:148 (-),score=24.56 TRINITY_DN16388_c0_g1_i1:57-500(-)
MDTLVLPFRFLRVPNFKLKIPTIRYPSPMLVFSFVFLSYFLVTSGIIYDIITETPSIGSTQDERTGSVKPVVFLQYRINGQFIIEGLSAGLLFVIGALGFIILDNSHEKSTSSSNRTLMIISGLVCIFLGYNLSTVFLRIKLPGYLN